MILVIPDIHEKVDKTKEILEKYENKVDRIIFLGDYFDSFEQPLEKCEETLKFLLDNISNEKMDFIYGNHDLHYLYRHRWLKCSGFKYEKYNIIYPYRDELKEKMKPLVKIDNYLFSHAGLTKTLAPSYSDVDIVNYVWNKTKHALDTGIPDLLLMPSFMRGGNQVVGGITWCDYTEFEPIEGYNQIFGHSQGISVRSVKGNYCLDTNLNHIALVDIESNYIKIEKV